MVSLTSFCLNDQKCQTISKINSFKNLQMFLSEDFIQNLFYFVLVTKALKFVS